MTEPATDTFVCPECGQECATASGLGAHRQRIHGIAGSSESARSKRANATTTTIAPVKRAPSMRKVIETEMRLCTMLADFYPKGIPTNDPTKLYDDLRFIEALRTRLHEGA